MTHRLTPDPAADQTTGASSARGTVLLVEDDPMVSEIVSELIVSLDYQVLSAASPADAIVEFRKHQKCIDIMLTDWLMPGSNGQELADTVYRIKPELKIIFMSGRLPDEAPTGRVMHFLQKPFGRDDLRRKLAEVIQQATPALAPQATEDPDLRPQPAPVL
jgi:CheY-like chemotaxis protein